MLIRIQGKSLGKTYLQDQVVDHEEAIDQLMLTPGSDMAMFQLVPRAVTTECRKNDTWCAVLDRKRKTKLGSLMRYTVKSYTKSSSFNRHFCLAREV